MPADPDNLSMASNNLQASECLSSSSNNRHNNRCLSRLASLLNQRASEVYNLSSPAINIQASCHHSRRDSKLHRCPSNNKHNSRVSKLSLSSNSPSSSSSSSSSSLCNLPSRHCHNAPARRLHRLLNRSKRPLSSNKLPRPHGKRAQGSPTFDYPSSPCRTRPSSSSCSSRL